MNWIYILKCDDNMYYIGQTTRLYRRFREHQKGKGGVNTSNFLPEEILAIYSVDRMGKFFHHDYNVIVKNYNTGYNIYFDRGGVLEEFNIGGENYDCLWVENNITEKMMITNKNKWKNIRGGKYVRFDCNYDFPINKIVENLPVCYCGMPCDVKQNEIQRYLFFRCAKKNIWEGMRHQFEIEGEPCDFFMKYTKDIEYIKDFNIRITKIRSLTSSSSWLKYIEYTEYCIGGCGKEYDENNTIRCYRRGINLCFDCFIDKNEELARIYTPDCLFGD